MSYNCLFPMAIDDYKEMIDSNRTYVDKTLFIKEFWRDGAYVVLLTRPRRFGKTLNLSMLKYFFEKTSQDTSYLFKNTNIWADPEYQALQGQFPVIFLTFKDFKADSWESACAEFATIISEECKRLLHCISVEKIKTYDIDEFNRLMNKQASERELTHSIQFLTRLLQEQTGKSAIVLIDEYDAPITHGHLKGYFSKVAEFIESLFSKALKSNSALKRGFLTGITCVPRCGIFSGFNNFCLETTLSRKYADKFGFTQNEVDQLLVKYNLVEKKDEIKRWYNGYMFGSIHADINNTINMYNPWSLLNFIDNNGVFQTYWTDETNTNFIKNFIASSNQRIKDETRFLLEKKEIVKQVIDEYVTLQDLIKNDSQALWSILFLTGFLTPISSIFEYDRYHLTLVFPNLEMETLYKELIA